MKKKSEQKKIEEKLWKECRRIIFTRYGDFCYTCDKRIEGANRHCGHFIPKGACGAFLKYDLRNLRPQCYHDNINLGGAGAEFYRRMLAREGQDYIDKLFEDKKITVKAIDHYKQLLSEYEKM